MCFLSVILLQYVSGRPAVKALHYLTMEMNCLSLDAGWWFQFQTMWNIVITPACLHYFQVYQYMHETITVNGCPEYQARATAKVRAALEIWIWSLHQLLFFNLLITLPSNIIIIILLAKAEWNEQSIVLLVNGPHYECGCY